MGLFNRIRDKAEQVGELMADGWRGRPDVDLREWASSRELDFRDQASQLGYLGAFIWIGNGDSAGLHHPSYNFNDDVIPFGTSYWVRLVETALVA